LLVKEIEELEELNGWIMEEVDLVVGEL